MGNRTPAPPINPCGERPSLSRLAVAFHCVPRRWHGSSVGVSAHTVCQRGERRGQSAARPEVAWALQVEPSGLAWPSAASSRTGSRSQQSAWSGSRVRPANAAGAQSPTAAADASPPTLKPPPAHSQKRSSNRPGRVTHDRDAHGHADVPTEPLAALPHEQRVAIRRARDFHLVDGLARLRGCGGTPRPPPRRGRRRGRCRPNRRTAVSARSQAPARSAGDRHRCSRPRQRARRRGQPRQPARVSARRQVATVRGGEPLPRQAHQGTAARAVTTACPESRSRHRRSQSEHQSRCFKASRSTIGMSAMCRASRWRS